LTSILSVHPYELQSDVGENGEAKETGGRGGTRGRRMVMGAEKHGIICHGRRLAERAGGQEI
jgi:hypothetical protein